MKDLPKNSHMVANAILRVDYPSYHAETPDFMTAWGWQSGWVYLKLRPGTDVKQIEAQMPAWEKRNIPDDFTDGLKTNQGDDQDWHLVNVRDVHLGEAQEGDMTPGNDQRTITTFMIIAILILGHGGRQFHQPRHRPGQPAGARSRAAQGARRQPAPADRPVRRRSRCSSRRYRCWSRWRWSNCWCGRSPPSSMPI